MTDIDDLKHLDEPLQIVSQSLTSLELKLVVPKQPQFVCKRVNSGLRVLKHLKKLDLSENILGLNLKAMLSGVGQGTLQHLYLSDCTLQDIDFKFLGHEQFKTLFELDVSANKAKMSVESLDAIVKTCQDLRLLNLRGTSLKMGSPDKYVEQLVRLQNLQGIKFTRTQFAVDGHNCTNRFEEFRPYSFRFNAWLRDYIVPDMLCQLPNLVYFNMKELEYYSDAFRDPRAFGTIHKEVEETRSTKGWNSKVLVVGTTSRISRSSVYFPAEPANAVSAEEFYFDGGPLLEVVLN
jgi:hypothetical protein